MSQIGQTASQAPIAWWQSLRVKLFALVGVGVLATVASSGVGLSGLSAVNANVVTLDRHVVKPMAAFASLRDALGDSRVNVTAYLDATSAAERAAVAKDITASDQAIADGVAAYRSAHANTADARSQLMSQFQTRFAAWSHIRDSQVVTAADSGHNTQARAAAAGPLAAANDAMAAPLDQLFTDEQAAGDTTAAQAAAAYTRVQVQLAAVTALAVLAAGLAAWSLTRRILRAVAMVRGGLDRLASGDLTWQAPATSGADELTAMIRAAALATSGVRAVVTRVVDGITVLKSAVEQLGDSSTVVESASSRVSSQAQGAAGEAAQVSGNVQTVAAGAEQMSATIREIAGTAQEAARVAQGAVLTAANANEQASHLGESSTQIMAIVKVITQIAEQTNLLALNATIEAARAGDAGKGFAVVANEVKELANETARATDDITHRVEAILTDTAGVVTAIDDIRAVIDSISEMQTTVAGAVEEQSATTQEISRNVNEAAHATDRITERIDSLTQDIHHTQEGVHASRISNHDLTQVADQLRDAVAAFQL